MCLIGGKCPAKWTMVSSSQRVRFLEGITVQVPKRRGRKRLKGLKQPKGKLTKLRSGLDGLGGIFHPPNGSSLDTQTWPGNPL